MEITKHKINCNGKDVDYNLIKIDTIPKKRDGGMIVCIKPNRKRIYYPYILSAVYLGFLGFLLYLTFEGELSFFNILIGLSYIVVATIGMYLFNPFLFAEIIYFLNKENSNVYSIFISKDCKNYDRVLEHELLHLQINELSLVGKDWKDINERFHEVLEQVTLIAMKKEKERNKE